MSNPGIVMIHEWWGLNDTIKEAAFKLAKEGYEVIPVDLFGGKVATTPDDAMSLVKSIDQKEATTKLRATVDKLRARGASKVASLGWCFGGGQSLQLALSGEQLDATVLYYGTPLVTDPDKLSIIKWPVLGIFGDKDEAIPISTIKAFEKSLNTNNITNEMYIYPNVGHAFANPTGPNSAPMETQDAWLKTLTFLRTYLLVG
jgi:carboxymethylenebutenolidase